jgi:hypothetical protein
MDTSRELSGEYALIPPEWSVYEIRSQACFANRHLFAGFLLHGLALALPREVGNSSAGPVKAAHLTAELLSSAPAIAPGGSTKVALVLYLEPGWHVYWVDAGDSGEPPSTPSIHGVAAIRHHSGLNAVSGADQPARYTNHLTGTKYRSGQPALEACH